MSVEPTGPISLPLDKLRLTIAESATFQAWVGAANATEAFARVYLISKEAPILPFARVGMADNFGAISTSGGTRNYFEDQSDLQVAFRGSVDAEHSIEDAVTTFNNAVGAILKEMKALAGTAEFLNIMGCQLDQGPYMPDEDERTSIGNYIESIWIISWTGPG